MLSLALAVAVLTAPPTDTECDCPCRPSTMNTVALCLELRDPAENLCVFNCRDEYPRCIRIARNRYAEIFDAPPASDAKRFPDRDWLGERRRENREYHSWLEDHYALTHEDWLLAAMCECDKLYEIYGTARDCKSGYYIVTVRRQYLKVLRDLIGPEMYYAGRLPPHLPIWRFWAIGE